MTLDEAIKRYINNAEYERTHGNLQGCLEFKQLAEWLKDYKRLLEQEPKTGHWKRISMDKYSEHSKYWYRCDRCGKDNLGNTDWCPNCGARMAEPQERSEE